MQPPATQGGDRYDNKPLFCCFFSSCNEPRATAAQLLPAKCGAANLPVRLRGGKESWLADVAGCVKRALPLSDLKQWWVIHERTGSKSQFFEVIEDIGNPCFCCCFWFFLVLLILQHCVPCVRIIDIYCFFYVLNVGI